MEDTINVSPGYSSNAVIRWGDAVLPGAPEFSLSGQTAKAAAKQFGFSCDYNGCFPLLPGRSRRGLVAVNHENTSGVNMFPGYDRERTTAEQAAIEIAPHGMSVVELRRTADGSAGRYRGQSRQPPRLHRVDEQHQVGADAADSANPRGPNTHGHILELTESGATPARARSAGPESTPDYETLFVSVRHLGEDDGLDEPSSTSPTVTSRDRAWSQRTRSAEV